MLERILIGLTFVTVFFLIVETLTFRSLWKVYQGMSWWPTMKLVWWGVHIVVWAAFLAAFFMWPTWRGSHPVLLKSIMAVTFALTIPKLFVCVIQGLDELRALGVLFWLKFTSQPTEGAMSRGSFLNVLGQGVGILAFLGMGYGITKGKYAYKVRKHLVRHPMLPKALKGCVWCNSVMRIWVRSKAHLSPC